MWHDHHIYNLFLPYEDLTVNWHWHFYGKYITPSLRERSEFFRRNTWLKYYYAMIIDNWYGCENIFSEATAIDCHRTHIFRSVWGLRPMPVHPNLSCTELHANKVVVPSCTNIRWLPRFNSWPNPCNDLAGGCKIRYIIFGYLKIKMSSPRFRP